LEKPLQAIKKASPVVREINEMFEPLKDVENKRTLEEMYSQSPVLLRGQDSNL